MPSGKTARPNITDNKDGTITVRYAPTEKGLHHMGIKYDGNHIPGESGPGSEGPTGASFLPAFFQQIFTEQQLYAETCQPLGGADFHQSGPVTGKLQERTGGPADTGPSLCLLQEAPCSSTWMPSIAATSVPTGQA